MLDLDRNEIADLLSALAHRVTYLENMRAELELVGDKAGQAHASLLELQIDRLRALSAKIEGAR